MLSIVVPIDNLFVIGILPLLGVFSLSSEHIRETRARAGAQRAGYFYTYWSWVGQYLLWYGHFRFTNESPKKKWAETCTTVLLQLYSIIMALGERFGYRLRGGLSFNTLESTSALDNKIFQKPVYCSRLCNPILMDWHFMGYMIAFGIAPYHKQKKHSPSWPGPQAHWI